MRPRVWVYICQSEAGCAMDQTQRLQAIADQRGFILAGTTVEPIDTPTLSRPGIQQIIDAAERNAVDVVYTSTIKNIGKKRRDLEPFLRIMRDNAVAVYSRYQGLIQLPDEVM